MMLGTVRREDRLGIERLERQRGAVASARGGVGRPVRSARSGLMRFSVAGSGGDYARYGDEAALLARECGDPALRAAIGTFPAYGHFHAGEGRAALEWSARVLEEVGSDNVLGKELVGYSPRVGALHVRAQALIFLGRLPEAWNQVEALREALDLYRAIGATGHAERLARELRA